MKEALISLSALIVIGLFFAVVLKLSDLYFEWYYTRRDEKRKAEHPALYAMFNEHEELFRDARMWWNYEVAARKHRIDEILKDWNYYTEERKGEHQKELDKLREELQKAAEVANEKNTAVARKRDEIKRYTQEHEIKWADPDAWDW